MVAPPYGHDNNRREIWDLSTALMTGTAAAAVAAVMGAVLHGGVVLTILAAVLTGVIVALLAGYRPLHEPDAERAESEFQHHWDRKSARDRAA